MLLQALCWYYQRLANDPNTGIVAEGYAVANVSACIVLDREGNVVGVEDLRVSDGKKLQPQKMNGVPLQPKRSSSKPEAAFLCENIPFIFGIYDKPDGAQYRFEASYEKHVKILSQLNDMGARALLLFFDKRVKGSYKYDINIMSP